MSDEDPVEIILRDLDTARELVDQASDKLVRDSFIFSGILDCEGLTYRQAKEQLQKLLIRREQSKGSTIREMSTNLAISHKTIYNWRQSWTETGCPRV